ncbi:NlpC/P60 family protein [Vibrio sp. S4M6]|uniref:C40 family peptidase n=1 Tax=Vibrio sinus TaxID=2946865 RepID=UPI00202A4CE5|nr:NlpC/P60 family protein [Vibrio sinus]MCL9783625.1 NlpC/P60 family protein [Vibrio sinus]
MSVCRHPMLLPLPALLLAGCASIPTTSSGSATAAKSNETNQMHPTHQVVDHAAQAPVTTQAQDSRNTDHKYITKSEPENLTSAEQMAYKISLINSYQTWAATPYEYGGDSSKGIDCSAFVRQVYIGALGVYLPRTTLGQVKLGKEIPKDDLQIGDLVFFKTGVHERHVGIYLGNNKFISSTSSRGVAMSSLKHPYWVKDYWQARRVVANDDVIKDLKQALQVRTQNINEEVNRTVVARIEKERREEAARAAEIRKEKAREEAARKAAEQAKLLADRHGEAFRKGHVRACFLRYSWLEHTVKSGDSLDKIARHFSISVDQLKKDNHLKNNVIRIGEVLKVRQSNYPAGFDYKVKSGDTLSGIANKFHTSVSEIKDLNDLDSSVIKYNQSLKLPC